MVAMTMEEMRERAAALGWKEPGLYVRAAPGRKWVFIGPEDFAMKEEVYDYMPAIKDEEGVWADFVRLKRAELDFMFRNDGCGIGFIEELMDDWHSLADYVEACIYEDLLWLEPMESYGAGINDPMARWWTDVHAFIEWNEENFPEDRRTEYPEEVDE